MTWTLGPDLPFPLWGHCAVIFDGKIVVLGGWSTRKTSSHFNTFGGTSNQNEKIRVERSVHGLYRGRTWEKLPRMGTARSTHGCTVTYLKVHSVYTNVIVHVFNTIAYLIMTT